MPSASLSNTSDIQKPIYKVFPFLVWLKDYSAVVFRSDLIAGLTVAVVLIPQAMASAMLAGLPPVYGLYAGAVTPFISHFAVRGFTAAAALIFFLWKTMHPRIVRVTKDPDLNMIVNADLFQKPSCPQILQLRSDKGI